MKDVADFSEIKPTSTDGVKRSANIAKTAHSQTAGNQLSAFDGTLGVSLGRE